ncbi:MAG: hypothetical protein DWH91_05155 [Planctomycetota bacterium]|nr:MAG: hypothetical protein DWH91_05155 [Planctomycetota bacterium]
MTQDDPIGEAPLEGEPAVVSPEESGAGGTRDRAGRSVDQGLARVFPCEACGADLQFSIGQQTLHCPYCGHSKELEFGDEVAIEEQDFQQALQRLEHQHEQGRHDEVGNQEVRCESCGGTVMFAGTLTSTSCPWCAAAMTREQVHSATHRIPVDGVLPFLVDRRRAQELMKGWIDSRWFAPNEFRRKGVDGKFDGVYLPFWTFDAMTFNAYTGQRGEDYTVTVGSGKDRRTETRTRWYSASGRFQRFFDDVLICGSSGLPLAMIDALEPWPLEKMVPFTQQVLAGFFARTYDVALEPGFETARERMADALREDVRRRIGGDRQKIDKIQTRHDAITFKHLLLPVWTLAYRYNEKTFRLIINAATGEVQGERPYSWVKITLLVLTIAAAVGTVWLLTQK